MNTKPTPASVVALGIAASILTVAAPLVTASFWPEGGYDAAGGVRAEQVAALTVGGLAAVCACVCWAGALAGLLLAQLADAVAAGAQATRTTASE